MSTPADDAGDVAALLNVELIAKIWRDHHDCTWISTGHDVVWSCGIIHPRPIHMQPTTRDRHLAALVVTQIEADLTEARAEVDSLRATLAAVGGAIRNIRTQADQSATHHPSVLHSIANDLLAIITPPRTCRPVYGSCGLESGHPGAHNARALAADPVSLADVRDVPTCVNCGNPIRRNAGSSTGWEHYPDPPDPAKGWQGIRCPGRLTGAEAVTDHG